MVNLPFTEYDVQKLVRAGKFIHKVMQDNTQPGSDPLTEKRILYDVRKKDSPKHDIKLRLFARLSASLPGVGVKSTAGISLQWKGRNIRKVDYKLRHDVVQNGIVTGFIRGWHEHIWTDEDEDRYIVEADPPVKQSDLRAVLRWCFMKWNIDSNQGGEQLSFGDN
jgi:hypothetical protein